MATQPGYLTITNPLDAYPPAIELLDQQTYTGEVFHIYTPGPGAYAGLEQSGNGVDFPYEVPEDTVNGILRLRLSIKPHEQDEIDGERMYCFIYYEDPDDAEDALSPRAALGVVLGGSFLMGAWVFLRCMSAVKPPPWMTKRGRRGFSSVGSR